ncbi:MAG: SH3 domain-containing protein, partial [Acidobacteriota bacterium]|nr:SH3 domain-containing protein [Acidobacteriota bacterium]
MRRILVLCLIMLLGCAVLSAQKRGAKRKLSNESPKGSSAVVIDQRLSVLRQDPSLYASPLKRLDIGTEVTVLEEKEADGVLFYKVAEATAVTGWIQSEAIAGKFRKNDDQRVFQLILGSTGFVQIQRGALFLDLFDDSPFRPSVLLLFGDIVEEEAAALTKRADAALVRGEMAAARAPLHSFYLNYV